MIRVLQSLEEIERAKIALQKKGLSCHGDPIKNWDLLHIGEVLERRDKETCVLDMGCGGTRCAVLKFLYSKGLTNCCGIDLKISVIDRLTQIGLMMKNGRMRFPFRLVKGDLERTMFEDNSFDVVICLSVIEHGVDSESFLKEVSRLLRPHGTLYVSTDYWEPKISTEGLSKPFGLDWTVFSRREIEEFVAIARKNNFRIEDENIPAPRDKVIHWNGRDYTEISLTFQKKTVQGDSSCL